MRACEITLPARALDGVDDLHDAPDHHEDTEVENAGQGQEKRHPQADDPEDGREDPQDEQPEPVPAQLTKHVSSREYRPGSAHLCHAYSLMNLPGPAAKQPSPSSGQTTTKVVRFPQPVTPTVNSAR